MTPEIGQEAKKQEITRLYNEERARLSELPYFDRAPGHREDGVLLSDWIEYYSGDIFKLIAPFNRSDCLRPAGYNLRVGDNYAIGGKLHTLNTGGELTIGPYQVAVIQTLETLNLPDFLIGRWNIRVKFAYRGLLWVGGAQVDPGFRGRLSCPIYNLSKIDVTLKHGEQLAMIDFVTTTSIRPGVSKPFQWWDDKKLVFQQYSVDLESGVESQLQKINNDLSEHERNIRQVLSDSDKQTTRDISGIQNRIDTFVSLVFTVVAVLFTALGIVATKGSDATSFVSSTVWISAVALYFALRPYVLALEKKREDDTREKDPCRSKAHGADNSETKWYATFLPSPLEVFIATIIIVAALGNHLWGAHVAGSELREAKERAAEAVTILEQQRQRVEAESQLRERSDARLESLQQQVNLLLQRQVTHNSTQQGASK